MTRKERLLIQTALTRYADDLRRDWRHEDAKFLERVAENVETHLLKAA